MINTVCAALCFIYWFFFLYFLPSSCACCRQHSIIDSGSWCGRVFHGGGVSVYVCVCVWMGTSECTWECAFTCVCGCVYALVCSRVGSYTILTVFVIFCSHWIACLWRMCNKSWQNITKHKCVFINKGKLFQALHIFSCECDTEVKLFQSGWNYIEIEFWCVLWPRGHRV